MPAAHRAQLALTQLARDYPDCWRALDELVAEVRADGVTWAPWCWAPMAASYAIVSDGKPLSPLDPRVADVSRMAALSAWRPTQGIYSFDEVLLEELWDSTVDGALPVETLLHLPEWCLYIETPARRFKGDTLHGFWVHLEHDAKDRRIELRLLLDAAIGRIPVPLHLGRGRGTLEEALQGTQDAALAALANSAFRQAPFIAGALQQSRHFPAQAAALEPLVSVVLYLATTAEALRAADGRTPSHPSPRPGRRGEAPRYYPPSSPAVYPTGVRLGATLRAARARLSSAEASSSSVHLSPSPTPHVRRAHWHTYLLGPRTGEQRRDVRWQSPILVGGEPDVPSRHLVSAPEP